RPWRATTSPGCCSGRWSVVSSFSDPVTRCVALAAALLASAAGWAAEDPARLAEKAREAARQVQIDVTPLSTVDRERIARIAATGADRGRVELERQAAELRARTEVSITISEEGL